MEEVKLWHLSNCIPGKTLPLAFLLRHSSSFMPKTNCWCNKFPHSSRLQWWHQAQAHCLMPDWPETRGSAGYQWSCWLQWSPQGLGRAMFSLKNNGRWIFQLWCLPSWCREFDQSWKQCKNSTFTPSVTLSWCHPEWWWHWRTFLSSTC